MKVGDDEVEQNLQQELDKLKEEGSAAWGEPEYIEHRRRAYRSTVEKNSYIIYDSKRMYTH